MTGLPYSTIKSWEMMRSYISPAASTAGTHAKRFYTIDEAFRLTVMRHLHTRNIKPEHGVLVANQVLDSHDIGHAIGKHPRRPVYWYKAAQRVWVVNHNLDRQVGIKVLPKTFQVIRLRTTIEDGVEHTVEYFDQIGRYAVLNSLILNIEGVMARFIVSLIGEQEFERMPMAGSA